MQKYIFLLLFLPFLICKPKPSVNVENQKLGNDEQVIFIKNEQFAADTLKHYEQHDSIFKDVNANYFIFINQKTIPKLAIIGNRHGKKYFFLKKRAVGFLFG